MLGCTNIHGEEVIDCLRFETLSVELTKGGSNVTGSARGFLHCGLFPMNNRTGFAVLDVKMSTEATECVFDFIEQSLGNGILAGCPPHLDLGGLELKVD